MTLSFIHTDLDTAKSIFNGRVIELRKNSRDMWEIWVEGKKTKGEFDSKRLAMERVDRAIINIKQEHGLPNY